MSTKKELRFHLWITLAALGLVLALCLGASNASASRSGFSLGSGHEPGQNDQPGALGATEVLTGPTRTPTRCATNYIFTTATATIVPGTTDIGNHCDDCTTHITLPFSFEFYDRAYNSIYVSSNGALQFVRVFSSFGPTCPMPEIDLGTAILPHWDDLRTDAGAGCPADGCGVFTSVTGIAPNRVFNIEWHTRYFAFKGVANFEAQMYESSFEIRLIYGQVDRHGQSAIIGVQDGTYLFTQFSCDTPIITPSLSVLFNRQVCGTGTSTPTPTPIASGTPTPTPSVCVDGYTYSTPTATATCPIVPGTVDTGNACDDCITQISLPFPFRFYGQTFTWANLSSNGNIQFMSSNPTYNNNCLPQVGFNYAMFPLWDDLRTDAGTGCPATGCGIFTSITGSAPDRVFNIEWRARYFAGSGGTNFEAQLYEGAPSRFRFVYGEVSGSNPTIGIQQGTGPHYIQIKCNGGPPSPGTCILFTEQTCATPTPTPTSTTSPATATSTCTPEPPTRTATPTSTPCPMSFSDVQPGDYFYEAVRYLYCAGVVSGYADSTFRPYNYTTRGQLSKIIVLARGWTLIDPPTPTCIDVPRGSTFYQFVETAYDQGIFSTYSCGTGCMEFRPGNNVTRGQLSKIVVLAMGWPLLDPKTPHFMDVPRWGTFYQFIETALAHGIISGYGDGTFRPGNNATRGQICKIVHSAITQP